MKVSLNEVNLFCLQKHHLTDDAKIDDIVQITNDTGGQHATGSTTPYLSLFARTPNFARDDLDEELYVKRTLGKIRCVRGTVYVLTRQMIPIAFSATRRTGELASERYAQFLGVTKAQYEETSQRILEILKGRGLATREIKKALKTGLNVSAIVNLMCDQGLLIRGKAKAGWRSNTHTYYPFHEYFPDVDLNVLEEAEAKRLLVRRYLASFGPVTDNDFAWWAGFPKGEVVQILDSLRDEITQVEISGVAGRYVMLSADVGLMQSTKLPRGHAVNLLPALDPYLMGYRERERYLDHEYCDRVFDRGGNATSTILLDGRIAGVWDFVEKPRPQVKLHLFGEVERDVLDEIYEKAQAMGRFMADREAEVKECESMVPLPSRNAGGFMSPLRDS